jgi:hypothetical protein
MIRPHLKNASPIVGYLEKVRIGALSFGLSLSNLHGLREVVDEVRVDLQHHRLGERGHEHISNLLLLEKFQV